MSSPFDLPPFRIPWTTCPECRRSIGGNSDGPRPGDTVLCAYCSAVLTLEADGSLRRARLADIDGVEEPLASQLRNLIGKRTVPA